MMVDHKTILVYFTFGSVFLSSVYSSTVVNMDKCTGIYCVAPECDRGDMFVPEGECCLVCPKDKCSGVVCPDCPNQGRPDGECCPFCSIGVAFLPQPNIVSTLIRFNKARASTFTPYVDHLESFLQYYENPYQLTAYGMTVYCSTFTEFRPHEDWDKACTFDIVDLGADCVKQQSFGYEDGQPCVMLKLNRIFDWMPEPYTNETRPDAIADTWTQYAISVKCEGELYRCTAVKHELTRTVKKMVEDRTMLVCLTFGSMVLSSVYSATVTTEVANSNSCPGIHCAAPGLAFLPRPNTVTTLIRFNKARPSTYAPYVGHLESLLQNYENEYLQRESVDIVDCTSITEFRPHDEWDKACRFAIVDLGADCVKQQSFGYEDGQPCVLLKLNRIFDWMPEPYTNETRPGAIADTWTEYAISVKCEGELPYAHKESSC